MLKKIAKALLFFTAFVCCLAMIFGLVLVLDWPWWTGFFVFLGLVGLIIGFIFVKKIVLRSKERRFVDEIIAQDDHHIKSLSDQEKNRSKEVQDRWKEAVETLKRSHLKKQGNPLYVLPWYLVLGESGTGKTTAIKSARLSSTFAENTRVSGLSGTRNCDWWFFEHAIIIDTAGRYAIPVDESRDKDEWRTFLPFLAKYRKKEPLNGLIVTVSADKLLAGKSEELEEDGKLIRSRIDELMLALGAKFPVYILVTKCDLIQGMTQFCDQLPESGVNQPMGYVNNERSEDIDFVLSRAFESLDEQLRNLRLLLLHEAKNKIDPALILFPDEFIKTQTGLNAFMKGAFHKNPYQETPIIRGLFFSSGRQEGTPYSHFLQALGMIEEKEVLPGTSKGLFLHDFFADILPTDRGIFAPTTRAIEWNRLTRNLGLTSWVALAVALCGLMSFAFVKNLKTIREVPDEFRKSPVLQSEIHSDVSIMDRYRSAILAVANENKNWWIPRFGLHESNTVEKRLKTRFSKQFDESLLVPLDRVLAAKMSNVSPQTPDTTFANYITLLVRRINILRSFLETGDYEIISTMPSPPYELLLSPDTVQFIADTNNKFAQLYLANMIWTEDSSRLNREMNDLQKWLSHILTIKDNSLNWLVAWANEQQKLKPVTLDSFWIGSNPVEDSTIVPPAFTKEGRSYINSFLAELESALPEPGPPLIARQKIEFSEFYNNLYVSAWFTFCSNFSDGRKKLTGVDEWRQMVHQTVKDDSPYFALLDRLFAEFEFFADNEMMPPWIELVYQFEQVKKQSGMLSATDQNSIMRKATKKGQTLIGKVSGKVGRTLGVQEAIRDQVTVEQKLVSAEAYLEYRNSLLEIIPLTASRRSAYEAAYKIFKDDPATSPSPFYLSQRTVNKVKAQMSTGKGEEKIFWKLLMGPLEFLADFIRTEASCHLQDLWETDVLSEIQGVTEQQTVQKLLFDQGGYAKKFINERAAPFLNRSRSKGYYPKKIMNGGIDFNKSFLTFITKGNVVKVVTRSSYDIVLGAIPTDVNSGAQIKPHATHFKINCASKTLRLDNFHFPVKKTFKWEPDSCGDITFQIEVGDLILTEMYTGQHSFAKFLNDFRTGEHSFSPKDFPNDAAALKRLGIDYIIAKYEIGGDYKEALKLLKTGPGNVPTKVSSCWGQ